MKDNLYWVVFFCAMTDFFVHLRQNKWKWKVNDENRKVKSEKWKVKSQKWKVNDQNRKVN